MLITDLAMSNQITLVERSQLNKIMEEIELQKSPYINPDTAASLGKGLGAGYIVTGNYLVMSDMIRVNIKMVDGLGDKIQSSSWLLKK